MNVSGNETNVYEDGRIRLPMYTFQFIAHPIVFVVCIPMNLIVAYVIITNRKLHNARNATWLGVAGSNLMILFVTCLQHVVVNYQSYAACQVVTLMFGKPYAILQLNLLLATCDRTIYTKWPLFHERHVTALRVVTCQFVCSTGAFLAFIASFLTGAKPIQCGVDSSDAQLVIGAISVLNLLCIVAKLVVYLMATRSNAARQRGVVVKRIKAVQPSNNVIVREMSQPTLRVHRGSGEIHQMEWNASMTLVANLIPMTIFASLAYLYMFSQLLCRSFFGDCETLNYLVIFFREVVVFHACTDLLVYIFRSLEFRSAFFISFPCLTRLFLGSP